jgi:hypothetical protein
LECKIPTAQESFYYQENDWRSMREPIGISIPYRYATSEELEAFNDIERMSKVKQEILRHPSKEAKLIAEVVVLTEMVRVLSARVSELEGKND